MKIPAFLLLLLAANFLGAAEPNTLRDAEKADGWKLLFDGEKIDGWRLYGKDELPKQGWVVENGTLHKQADVKAGDIMTVETYENFEFSWEWKILKKGNNGVKYFITQEALSDGG